MRTLALLISRSILLVCLIYIGFYVSASIIDAGTGDAPAEFKVTSLVVSPSNISIGEKVTIRVTVFNMGGKTGDYQVTLKINDIVEQTKVISIENGESEDAAFSVSEDKPGDYKVSIGSSSSTFTVHESYSRPISLPILILISFSILLFVTLIVWLIRKKLKGAPS